MTPILSLHGFLGLPADWQDLNVPYMQAFNLYDLQWNGLWDCAKQLNHQIKAKQKFILMGYSLGGRLALHALIDQPKLWKAAIIISAHPGLKDAKEKEQRLQMDSHWAERFRKEEWKSLLKAWNKRGALSSCSFEFSRQESDYERLHLATMLEKGSLGLQENLGPFIAKLPMPILWIVGEQDKTYINLANEIAFQHLQSKTIIVPNVGHRVPWEHPQKFKRIIENFRKVRRL